MQLTKTELFEEMKQQGIDEATINALMEDLSGLPEQLSDEDLNQVDAVLAQVEGAEKLASFGYSEMADQLEKAADAVLDATDEYIDDAARITYNHVKLANDLLE